MNYGWKIELADSYSWLGSVLQARGDLEQALELHQAQVAITTDVLTTDPENSDYQRRLSIALQLLGQLMEDLGDGERAMDRFEQALAISLKLAQHDVDNTLWQRDLSSAHAGMGRILRTSGDFSKALAHLRQSIAVTERLLALDGSKSNWRHDAAAGHHSIGTTLLAMGDPEAARREVNTAIEIINKMLADAPGDREAILTLSEAYMLLGQIAGHTSAGERPMVAFARAAAMLEPVANGSTDKNVLDPWARALLHVDRVEDARPVIEKLHRMGFKGRQLKELCRDKGLLM